MTEGIKYLIEKMTEVVKGTEKDADPEKDHLRGNGPGRGHPGEKESDPLGESVVLFLGTQCSFQSFL